MWMQSLKSRSRKYSLWLLLGVIFAPNALTDASNETCSGISDSEKFDCLPELGLNAISQDACQSRNCCWAPSNSPDIPSCFYSQNYPGYIVSSNIISVVGSKTILERQGKSGFPDDVQQLAIDVEHIDQDILHVKIYDNKKTRFEPPIPKIVKSKCPQIDNPKYDVSISNDSASIKVIRKETNELLFDTGIGGFIFADQFLQLSSRLPSQFIYGLGEHTEKFLLNTNWKTYTIFNRGELPEVDRPQFNTYGTHPLYLSIEKSGKTYGVFLLNSNAMDIVLQPAPAITYRVIGGVLDFYFFMGPTPDDVISQYTSLIGRPALPPYWSLGFHLAKYNYRSSNKTREIWESNKDAGIPFDAQWNDIDYMDEHKMFTYDPVAFKGLRSLVDDIHSAGMRYVMIMECSLSGSDPPGSYPPYDEAKALDILVKDYKGDILKGQVWQNVSVFVDFSNPNTSAYWIEHFQQFHDQIPYDGAWIDMNEPYSFIWGSLTGCPANNTLDHPPYVPGKEELFNGTICLSSQHYLSTHYNIHSLYSTMEAIPTNMAMTQIRKKRPFVLSRATFASYGSYGAHWTGDVASEWSYLQNSIPNILNMNLFGIPFVGADICGFRGNTTFELCSRWSLLGAFYSFSRNHNDDNTIEQDPVTFGPVMVNTVTKVLKTRYLLLPYLYSLFYNSNLHGTPVLRPLLFDNLNDANTYSIDTQFLWGKALMITPVLEPNVTEVTGYFPEGIWYDFYTGNKTMSTGQNITLNSAMGTINLALKGGFILPLQEPDTTTTKSRKNPFRLLVALDQNSTASGELYWDEGESLDNTYNYITFVSSKNELVTTPQQSTYQEEPMILGKIQIYGMTNQPVNITANGQSRVNYTYDPTMKTLEISLDGHNITLLKENTFTWSF